MGRLGGKKIVVCQVEAKRTFDLSKLSANQVLIADAAFLGALASKFFHFCEFEQKRRITDNEI